MRYRRGGVLSQRAIVHGEDRTDYTEEETTFMMAMERYKREQRRPFPTCCEVLKVLKSLGYRKEG